MGEKSHSSHITSKDGTRLRVADWSEGVPARAKLAFLHGWAEYTRRYDHVAEWFGARDFACYGVDVRGHGHSDGVRGFIRNYDEYLDDCEAFVAWVLEQGDTSLPVYLVSHSQGGLIATRFAEQRPAAEQLAGMVISAPLYGLAIVVPGWKAAMGDVMSRLWPSLALEAGVDAETLSKDADRNRDYLEDPLIFSKATSRWFTETKLAQEQSLAEAQRIAVPVLLLHSPDDRVNAYAATRAIYDRLDVDDKTIKPYKGLRHELFNEVEREEVFTDVLEWLEARLPG
jgi:lysophospholipase